MGLFLKRAKRVRVSFEQGGEQLTSKSLIIDTELIRYKWTSFDGSFPDYEKLIPTEFNTVAHFDTVEAIKAIASLKVLANSKAYPIDLWLDDNTLKLANSEDKGEANIPADIEGKGTGIFRLDGQYLAEALKACGGIVDFNFTNAYSPMLFTVNGFQLVVMPMLTNEANEQAKREREAKAEAEQAEAVAKQAEPVKAKRSRTKEPAIAK